MSLRLPSEIVVDRFLPTARAMLARELDDHGLTQQDIAAHLGVTQAAVSQYIAGGTTEDDRLKADDRLAATVSRIADGFAEGTMDDYEALDELLSLIREFEDRGPICELHEEAMPSLRGLGCDLCVRGTDDSVRAERGVLADVRKAARLFATTRGAADLIPNVGTNVGSALPNPVDETDVAAIPGRIYALRGRVEIPANPEFGASQHVATTIIAANTVDATVRGAVNVATRDDVLAAARGRGLDPLEFEAGYDDRDDRLRARFEAEGGVPRVLYHRGSFGIEPITYVLGESAVDAVELLAALIHA